MGLLGNLYCETIAFEPQSSTDDLPTLLFGKPVRIVQLFSPRISYSASSCIIHLMFVGVYNYLGYEVVQLPPDSRTVVRETCFQYPAGTEFDAKASGSLTNSVHGI